MVKFFFFFEKNIQWGWPCRSPPIFFLFSRWFGTANPTVVFVHRYVSDPMEIGWSPGYRMLISSENLWGCFSHVFWPVRVSGLVGPGWFSVFGCVRDASCLVFGQDDVELACFVSVPPTQALQLAICPTTTTLLTRLHRPYYQWFTHPPPRYHRHNPSPFCT